MTELIPLEVLFGNPQRIDLGGVNYLFTLNFRF